MRDAVDGPWTCTKVSELGGVINSRGAITHKGGYIPDPWVMEAMKEASQNFVIMMNLMEKAGRVIAESTSSRTRVAVRRPRRRLSTSGGGAPASR